MTELTDSAWHLVASHLHGVLAAANLDVPLCGPGAPDDCGGPWSAHALSYAAMLQAWAENRIEHITHDDPHLRADAGSLLEHWRKTFTRDFAHDS